MSRPFVDREPDLFVACGVGHEKDGCGVFGAGVVEAVDGLEHLFASDDDARELHSLDASRGVWCERQ